MKTILLCSDLDRTLIPNGEQPESPKAREIFARLYERPEICLTYVSGRNELLVKEAIAKYDLPEPDFVIGDVGTTLYRIEKRKPESRWCLDPGWQQEIGGDWITCNRNDVVGLLAGIHGMDFRLQEEEKQNRFKVSYYTDPDLKMEIVRERISILLQAHGISSTVIWSRDDAARCGLLDILPPKANKLQAIRFLMKQEQIPEKNAVFAGDSGNDLDALTSGLQAILVRNSAADVRKAAFEELGEKGFSDSLYIAKGGLHGMNGNYAAGVLEGLVHFFPEVAAWIQVSQIKV
jgi:hypothetical protein